MRTLFDLKTTCAAVEGKLARIASEAAESTRKLYGESLANELVMSVACLFLARVITMLHVWTGEPVASIRKRCDDCLSDDIKASMVKLGDYMRKRPKQ